MFVLAVLNISINILILQNGGGQGQLLQETSLITVFVDFLVL